jgi:predicted AAA+ superfamily ATPase
MTESPTLERLLARAEAVLGRLEGILPLPPAAPDWESAIAFRWRKSNGRGWLQAVRHPHPIRLSDLETSTTRRSASPPTPASSSPASRPTTCC